MTDVPTRCLWVAQGNLIIQGCPDDTVNGTWRFARTAVEALAGHIGGPRGFRRYLLHLHDNHPDLFDVVAGYHLRGELAGEPSPHIHRTSGTLPVTVERDPEPVDYFTDGTVAIAPALSGRSQ